MNNISKLFIKIPFLLVFLLFLCDLENTAAQKNEPIQLDNLRKHMEAIASDSTEGRFTGTMGYKKAANYAVKVFQEAGLSPGYTSEKGVRSYLQPVPFIRNDYDTSTSMTIQKNGDVKTYNHSFSNFVVLNPGMNHYNQIDSIAFIGYGIREPEYDWDDYSGVDIEGRWVILFNGAPLEEIDTAFPNNLRKEYGNWKTKVNTLMEHKVAGLIILPDKKATANWEYTALLSYRYDYIRYANDTMNGNESTEQGLPVVLVSPDFAQTIMAGQVYDPVANKGHYHSFILENTEMTVNIDCNKESFNCNNIIAVVPGSDPQLSKEYITVGAHLDHLGKIGNPVYNGANDDASGCVIIFEAARAIALNPLKRSVMFILYTSEEQHLVGSKHFLNNPPVPLEQISLNINIEQIGSKNRDFPGILAIGSSQFEKPFYNSADVFKESDFKFELDEKYKSALRDNVDSWSYYQKEIPIIMLSSGGFPEHHTFHDKIELIDFEHLLVASNFLYSFIVELGN